MPQSQWRHPESSRVTVEDYEVGDEVFVKPGDARCTTKWPKGHVTAIGEGVQVEVDGTPRHVADIRQVPNNNDESNIQDGEGDDPTRQYPRRERKPTNRYGYDI
jgi:hypothetical protein